MLSKTALNQKISKGQGHDPVHPKDGIERFSSCLATLHERYHVLKLLPSCIGCTLGCIYKILVTMGIQDIDKTIPVK